MRKNDSEPFKPCIIFNHKFMPLEMLKKTANNCKFENNREKI